MNRSRDRAAAERRRQHKATVLAAVQRAAPDFDANTLEELLRHARAAAPHILLNLARHLTAHPDALSSGDPRCQPALVRLTHLLHEAGHRGVVRPGCASCGKITTDMPSHGPRGRRCQVCTFKDRLRVCARCGHHNVRIAARRGEGGICYQCYSVDPATV
jgi:hypothetical protein